MKRGLKLLAVWIFLMTCCFFASVPIYAVGTDEVEYLFAEQENVSEYIVQVGGLLRTEDESRMQVPKRFLTDGASANVLEAKEALYQGLMNHEEVISLLSYGLTGNEIRVLYPEVLNENPELIYLTGEFSWSYLNGTVKDVTPRYNSYTIDDREQLIAICESVVGDMPDTMPEEEKILYLHDYIVTHCEYDLSLKKFNAYNCLVEGSSVCQGYALAFCLLGKYAGIDIKLVTSAAQGHAWNIVQIDGMDYFVDATWDDPSGNWYELYCGHDNLLRSRDGMLETGHEAGKDWTATGIGNVYYAGINSTKYDSYYWGDVISPIPCIEGMYAYAKEGCYDKVFLRNLNGGEMSISIPENSIWHLWKQNSYYYTTNFSSFTSYDGEFYFNTPNKIYQMNTLGDYQVIYELNDEERSRGYIYGIQKNATGLNYWIGTDYCGVTFEKKHLSLNKKQPEIDKIRNFVIRMYENCLYREPDESGLNGWIGQLAGRYMDGAAIAEQFVFSSELLSHNLSDEDFVEMLYQAMMGRPSDAAGKSGWVAQLKNGYMTRSEVTKSFVESTEFSNICASYGIVRGIYDATIAPIEHFVTRFYTLCLERSTDQTGLYGWVGNLKSGEMNGAQIAEAFFFSEEFEEKKVSDEKYIDTLYMTLMNRPADEAGKKGYLSQMKAGYISRWYVMKVFIESAEFSGICEEYRIERGTLKATD